MRWIKFGVWCGLLGAVVSLFASFLPAIVDKVYSRGVYLPIVSTLSFFSSMIPFSLADFTHVAIAPVLLFAFYYGYRRKRSFPTGVWYFVGVGGYCYTLFLFSWGLNYKRPSFSRLMQIPDKVEKEKKESVLLKVARITNELRAKVATKVNAEGCFTIDEDLYAIDRTVAEAEENFLRSRDFPVPGYRPIKSRPFGFLLLSFGNSGIYGPFTGEANITHPSPPGLLAFTLGHERAHRSGFASETDASVVSFLSLISTDSPELQYAGYLALWDHVPKKEVERLGLSAPVQSDLKCIREFWKKYPDFGLRKLWKLYDWYLKLQGQKRGIESYSDAVDVLLRYWATQK